MTQGSARSASVAPTGLLRAAREDGGAELQPLGATIDEAIAAAIAALGEGMGDRITAGLAPPVARAPEAVRADRAPPGALADATLARVPLRLDSGRLVRVNVSLDDAAPTEIVSAARSRGLTRSAFLVNTARDKIQTKG